MLDHQMSIQSYSRLVESIPDVWNKAVSIVGHLWLRVILNPLHSYWLSHTLSPSGSGHSWCLSLCARQQQMLSWRIRRRANSVPQRARQGPKTRVTSDMPKWRTVGAKVCLEWLFICTRVESQVHHRRCFWGLRQVETFVYYFDLWPQNVMTKIKPQTDLNRVRWF